MTTPDRFELCVLRNTVTGRYYSGSRPRPSYAALNTTPNPDKAALLRRPVAEATARAANRAVRRDVWQVVTP
jgi:hypothetical protein